MIATSPLDLLRPFLWIAAIAFVLGFAGYALLGAGSIARTTAPQFAAPHGPTLSA